MVICLEMLRHWQQINIITGNGRKGSYYNEKADSIRSLLQSKLWNSNHDFFEVRKEQGDTLANVREEIGFIPWYFNMPDSQYNVAWKWLIDKKTFCRPIWNYNCRQKPSAIPNAWLLQL